MVQQKTFSHFSSLQGRESGGHPSNTMLRGVLENLHREQNVDPFSRFCRALARDRHTDRLTGRLTDTTPMEHQSK